MAQDKKTSKTSKDDRSDDKAPRKPADKDQRREREGFNRDDDSTSLGDIER